MRWRVFRYGFRIVCAWLLQVLRLFRVVWVLVLMRSSVVIGSVVTLARRRCHCNTCGLALCIWCGRCRRGLVPIRCQDGCVGHIVHSSLGLLQLAELLRRAVDSVHCRSRAVVWFREPFHRLCCASGNIARLPPLGILALGRFFLLLACCLSVSVLIRQDGNANTLCVCAAVCGVGWGGAGVSPGSS